MAQRLGQLLADTGLGDAAEAVGDGLYRIKWGSATLVAGVFGDGVAVIAPLFDAPPARDREEFFRRLLEINGELGGTAAFAVQPDGAVVLQVGRGIAGLDAQELGLMIGTVGKFADDWDDRLREEFYS